MKEKIQQVIEGIEKRIAKALGDEASFVTFGGEHGARDASQFEMEITLQMVQEIVSGVESQKEGLIREYLNKAGIPGKVKRSSSVDTETGETLVVYKVNLSTPERTSNIGGYLAAKYDDTVTFRDGAVERLAKDTVELIKAIDRKHKPEKGWGYADAAVFKQGTRPEPELPPNVVTEDQFAAARKEALANTARRDAAAGKYKSHYIGEDDLFPVETAIKEAPAARERFDPEQLARVLEQRSGAVPSASVLEKEMGKAVGQGQ